MSTIKVLQRSTKVKKRPHVKLGCGEKCKRKCAKFINEETRMAIFEQFWGMNSHKGRRDFVVSHVSSMAKKTLDRCFQQTKADIFVFSTFERTERAGLQKNVPLHLGRV